MKNKKEDTMIIVKHNNHSLKFVNKDLLIDRDIIKSAITYESRNRVAQKKFFKEIS